MARKKRSKITRNPLFIIAIAALLIGAVFFLRPVEQTTLTGTSQGCNSGEKGNFAEFGENLAIDLFYDGSSMYFYFQKFDAGGFVDCLDKFESLIQEKNLKTCEITYAHIDSTGVQPGHNLNEPMVITRTGTLVKSSGQKSFNHPDFPTNREMVALYECKLDEPYNIPCWVGVGWTGSFHGCVGSAEYRLIGDDSVITGNVIEEEEEEEVEEVEEEEIIEEIDEDTVDEQQQVISQSDSDTTDDTEEETTDTNITLFIFIGLGILLAGVVIFLIIRIIRR